MVPRGMCVHIGRGKAKDQVLEVLDHFNVCVREKDIFSRCQVSSAYCTSCLATAWIHMCLSPVFLLLLSTPFRLSTLHFAQNEESKVPVARSVWVDDKQLKSIIM